MTGQKQDNHVAMKTYQKRWTIGRSGERVTGISVPAARHDDDDDDDDGQLEWQKLMGENLFLFYKLILGYTFWPQLDDTCVSQSHREFYASYF